MIRFSCHAAFGMLVMISLVGCGSTGLSRTEGRIESIQQLRKDLTKGTQQIDVTVAALEEVVMTSAGDLRPAYAKFETQLAMLDEDAETARKRAATMKARTQEYFEAWKKEVETGLQNPELKTMSRERQAAAESQFNQLQAVSQGAREAYQKLSNDLHEVKKVLDLELNAAGLNAVKPFVGKTKESANTVKEQIMLLVTELDDTVAAITPSQGQPGAGAGGQPTPATSTEPAKNS